MSSLEKAASQVREVGAGFLPRSLGFTATSLHVRFVVHEVAVSTFFSVYLLFFPN
jgi:hypothetical protein